MNALRLRRSADQILAPPQPEGADMNITLRSVAVLAIVILVSIVSAGCGSSTSSNTGPATGSAAPASTSTSGGTTKLTAQAKAVKFSECVRAHGVSDFPDPDAKGEFNYGVSVPPAVFSKAVNACKALEPPGALSSKRTPKEQSSSLKFAACIRAHGVKDFPDPVNGEPAINTEKIPSTNTPNGMTVLNAAIDACRSVAGLGAGGQG